MLISFFKWVQNCNTDDSQCDVWIVLASDVIYNENVVPQLLHTLRSLTGSDTTVLLSGELRNGTVYLFMR